jgi:hypothetical protein
MMREMSFEELRNAMLFRRIVDWKDNYIKLDNGMELRIEETAQDCCAGADGEFTDVELDAAITSVSNIQYHHWEDGDTYGCSAEVTIMHNRNVICRAIGDADAGNGGYYYSIASFCVRMPNDDKTAYVHFVGSEDEGDGDVEYRY